MKSLVHYAKCAFQAGMRFLLNAFYCLKRNCKAAIGIGGCFLAVRKNENRTEPKHNLEYYYPDNGHLCEHSVFENRTVKYDLSIIIPMYNVEKYIDECLRSILDQRTDYSYEVVLIDDGSTDQTVHNTEKYLDYDFVQLLTQKNAGQSSARNNGIRYSSGRYLMFVDADDVLLPDAIELLLSAAEKTGSDIAEGNIVRFYREITDEMVNDSKGKNRIKSNKKDPRFVLSTCGYSVAKVFRRELWKTVRFPEGYVFEDVITKFILRRKANQVSFIDGVVYGYRQNEQSSTHGNNKLKYLDSIWVFPRIVKLCEQEKVPRDDVFYFLSLNHIGLLNCLTTQFHNDEIKQSCFAEMRKQLLSIQDCRPANMPLAFRLLDQAILENKFEAWGYIARIIRQYYLLKKWREVN